MGLLDQSQNNYYKNSSNFGKYQFTSLDDVINQFLVAYVGEGKITNKVGRTDVAFHAQRAMQELSFDTFKSIKSQEIVLPPTNTMILPHDYVNYTKLAWSDSAGIEHLLYPTSKTSNPFKILQNDDGSYDFWGGAIQRKIENFDFSKSINVGWTGPGTQKFPTVDEVKTVDKKLQFTHGSKQFNSGVFSRAYVLYQKIDVRGVLDLDITATGNSAAASASSPTKGAGVVRVGLVSNIDYTGLGPNGWRPAQISSDPWANAAATIPKTNNRNHLTDIFDLPTPAGTGDGTIGYSYLEFSNGAGTESTKSLSDAGENGRVDVSEHDEVFLVITSHVPNFTTVVDTAPGESVNTIDTILLDYEGEVSNLQSGGESTTWSNYKSVKPSENNNDDYEDDTYWQNNQKRYGLDPQHAQVNGSFYIDNLRGLINFSSNISGKTVILDYISDSLGTDGEMQVHKFAEEAMYRWILHAVAASRIQTQQIVPRLKKEKIAATRQAKLRLSNIKLEELTQILRGKSKHIKH